jgi:hypothetical protein
MLNATVAEPAEMISARFSSQPDCKPAVTRARTAALHEWIMTVMLFQNGLP